MPAKINQRRRFKTVQMELFALAEEQKQLRLRLTALKLLVRSLGVAILKRCAKCKLEMSAEQFYRDMRYTDGLSSYCRDCKREYYGSKRSAA